MISRLKANGLSVYRFRASFNLLCATNISGKAFSRKASRDDDFEKRTPRDRLRKPVTTDLQEGSENPEVDMFVKERVADAICEEYKLAQKQLRRSQAFRTMERGTQQPSLLTVGLKNELRRLASEDASAWPPARLATAFSISVSAVRRVLSSRWQPSSPQELERYERRVTARRRQLGLPTVAVQPPEQQPVAPAAPAGPLTALLLQPSRPPAAAAVTAPAVSAVYDYRQVLHVPVRDTAGRSGDHGGLDVPVAVPSRPMTLNQLKLVRRQLERKKKLQMKSSARAELDSTGYDTGWNG